MYESVAFQELIKHRPAFIFVHRVAYEHLCHGGTANGRLKITFDDFVKWGIGRRRVGDAAAIAEALGFVKLVKRGRPSWEGERYSSEYAMTWQSVGGELPTNDWRRICSRESARAKVAAAKEHRQAERRTNAERNKPRHLRTRPRTQFIPASEMPLTVLRDRETGPIASDG